MITFGWTEREEEFFDPGNTFMRYFRSKPIIEKYNTESKIPENKGPEIKDLYVLTLHAVTELKRYIKEHPEFLTKNIDDKKVAKEIVSKLVEKAIGKI